MASPLPDADPMSTVDNLLRYVAELSPLDDASLKILVAITLAGVQHSRECDENRKIADKSLERATRYEKSRLEMESSPIRSVLLVDTLEMARDIEVDRARVALDALDESAPHVPVNFNTLCSVFANTMSLVAREIRASQQQPQGSSAQPQGSPDSPER